MEESKIIEAKKNKKNIRYLLAFVLPLVLCLLILYFKDVFTDPEYLFVTDLKIQHLSFLNYLKSVMTGNSSIFYSYYAGMGSPMISTLIFYCMSPLNLLLVIINDVRYAILFIYTLKISLSGLTMYMLLRSKHDTDNFVTVLFSTCYALGCFVINYFFCVFWLDSLYLAPLVMMGIDKIFKYEKINLLYIFSLSLAIICNIQMGFGLCVYSVIYYIYSFNINYDIKKDFKKFIQLSIIFAISSLCAGAISSGALLGFGIDYGKISTARKVKITTSSGTSNIGFFFKNLFTVGTLRYNYFNNYEPYVYCGLIVSFFAVLYLFNNNIDKKKRKNALGVIIVFLLGFSISFINLFWHLSAPVLLNFRYSAYLGLFLTMIAYECYINKGNLTGKDITILFISFIIGLFAIIGYLAEVHVVLSFVFLILIFGFIILAKNKGKKFEILLFVLVLAEVFCNGIFSIYNAKQLSYSKDVSLDNLKELEALNDFDDNYRVLTNYSYTENANDYMLLNSNSSLRYFSSVISGNLLNFYVANQAAAGNNNYLVSAYDSPLLLSLLGNKYFYLLEEYNNGLYNKIGEYEIESFNYSNSTLENQKVYLYENPYALSLGYVIEKDYTREDDLNIVSYQNNIIKAFTGINNNVMIQLPHEQFADDPLCAESEYPTCYVYDVTNTTKNQYIAIYSLFDRYGLFDNNVKAHLDTNKPLTLSTSAKNTKIKLESIYLFNNFEFVAATFDRTNLINSLSILQNDMLDNIKIDGNVMTGTLDSSKDGILFLSIPYDKNFKIYVDDEEVEYYSLLDDTFIGLDVKQGVHSFRMEYVDENFKWYIISSVSSIIITLILYYFINKAVTKRKIEEERLIQENQNKKRAKAKSKRKK